MSFLLCLDGGLGRVRSFEMLSSYVVVVCLWPVSAGLLFIYHLFIFFYVIFSGEIQIHLEFGEDMKAYFCLASFDVTEMCWICPYIPSYFISVFVNKISSFANHSSDSLL